MKLTAGLVLLSLACASSPVPEALCAFDATRALPRDPDQVTLGQAKALAKALRACEAGPDAGSQPQ